MGGTCTVRGSDFSPKLTVGGNCSTTVADLLCSWLPGALAYPFAVQPEFSSPGVIGLHSDDGESGLSREEGTLVQGRGFASGLSGLCSWTLLRGFLNSQSVTGWVAELVSDDLQNRDRNKGE